MVRGAFFQNSLTGMIDQLKALNSCVMIPDLFSAIKKALLHHTDAGAPEKLLAVFKSDLTVLNQ
jgi:hypothetical protein